MQCNRCSALGLQEMRNRRIIEKRYGAFDNGQTRERESLPTSMEVRMRLRSHVAAIQKMMEERENAHAFEGFREHQS